MSQTHYLRVPVLIALSVLATTGSPKYVQAQAKSAHEEGTEGRLSVFPLSTTLSESMRKKIIIRIPTSVRWQSKEYGIDDGIDLLMGVITDPTTDVEMRATAINRLGHFSTTLQGRECVVELSVLYDLLGSRMDKREVLRFLTVVKDSAGLSLLYRVATTEPDDRLRIQAATGLAVWNIREGVHQLIGLLSSSAETGLRQVGAAAMISFTNLNGRKGWNCPQDDIRETALVIAADNREEYAKAAMKGYRDWFEANKERFPDWKPSDPLPEVEKEERKPETDK